MTRVVDCPRCEDGEVEILGVTRAESPNAGGLGGYYPGCAGGEAIYEGTCDCPEKDEDGFARALNEKLI